jgi:hypothetical protein
MLFEETNTEESGNSQSDVSSLDDGFSRMQFESTSSEEVTDDGVINPIDCYRHFITDEIIRLMVRETNQYAEQHIQTQKLTKRSKALQWRPTTNEEMFSFLGIILEMGIVQMPEIDYYWSKSKLFGSEAIQNTMSRDRFELLLKLFYFSNNQEAHADQDRLFKLRLLLDLLRTRFKSIYKRSMSCNNEENKNFLSCL